MRFMKKILAFTLMLILMATSCISAFAGEMIIEENSKYAEDVLKHDFAGEFSHCFSWDEFVANYREIYEYYGEDISSDDETVPDYVLVRITGNICATQGVSILGDYIMREGSDELALTAGYGIYVPREDKLYYLRDAYFEGIEGIEKVFTEAGIGELIGDTDKDRKLTVKDATLIQKFIAGLAELEDDYIVQYEDCWSTLKYISDFNRDNERNIKDATAIQKHIAGLEY